MASRWLQQKKLKMKRRSERIRQTVPKQWRAGAVYTGSYLDPSSDHAFKNKYKHIETKFVRDKKGKLIRIEETRRDTLNDPIPQTIPNSTHMPMLDGEVTEFGFRIWQSRTMQGFNGYHCVELNPNLRLFFSGKIYILVKKVGGVLIKSCTYSSHASVMRAVKKNKVLWRVAAD